MTEKETLYCPFEKNCDFYKNWVKVNNNRKDIINVSYLEQKAHYSCLALIVDDSSFNDKTKMKIVFERIHCSYVHILNNLIPGQK